MRWRRDRVVQAVVFVTLLTLVLRTVALGTRPFHWDEARVGYWALQSVITGEYTYRPVAGGPLVALLARWGIVIGDGFGGTVGGDAGGVTDAVTRLPIALVTSTLPLVALAFRGRLRDDETIALAILLSFTPLIAYYGRFIRGDVLAAGAALAMVGLLARWIDADRDRYLYAAAALAAVALGASGFAVATMVLLVVAGAVALDHVRVQGTGTTIPTRLFTGQEWFVERASPIARALFVFLGVWGLLFVLRGSNPIHDPVGILDATYRDPIVDFLAVRVAGRAGTEFLPFLTDAVTTLLATSPAIAVLALCGFIADRYRMLPDVTRERTIVTVTGVWAGLGLVGYPVVAEVQAPWTLVHVLVPATVPAAVALAGTYRYGRIAFEREDAVRVTTALLVIVAVGTGVAIGTLDGVYGPNDPENAFTSYGQPASDIEPVGMAMAEAVGNGGGGGMIVYVGNRYTVEDEAVLATPPIPTAADRDAFGERLPIAWYVARTGAETASVADPTGLDRIGAPIPVLVVDPAHESAVADRFPDHEAKTVELALWNREAVVFIRND